MATPRKRFTIVENSLLREPWPREVKLNAVLLMTCMADRWAADLLTAEQAARALLSPGDLVSITGHTDPAKAVAALKALARFVTLKVRPQPNGFVLVHWPKFPKKQGWPARPPAASGPDSGCHAPRSGPGSGPSYLSSPGSGASESDPPPPPQGEPAQGELVEIAGAKRWVLAAQRGWPAAQREAAQHGRKWKPLAAGSEYLRVAARACELLDDPTGACLARVVRGGVTWWRGHLPRDKRAEDLVEPMTVFERKNVEKFYDAGGVRAATRARPADEHTAEEIPLR